MLPVVFLLIAIWFIRVLWIIKSLYASRAGNQERGCLIVIIGDDQEHSVEGFLRKLVFFRNKFWPLFELKVLDNCQNNRTVRIASLLAAQNDFQVIAAGEREIIEFSTVQRRSFCYDARQFKDGELLKAPLFSLISSNQSIIEVKKDGQ